MLIEIFKRKINGMLVRIVMWLAMAVTVSAAGNPLPRKVVLNTDNLEILRLDIMAMEVRVSNNVKEQSDRVVAALNRHGAKLDESGADLRRSNIAMAAALDRQAARMDVMEDTLNHLVNATLFQVDVRPLISGFEKVVKSARLEAWAAAEGGGEGGGGGGPIYQGGFGSRLGRVAVLVGLVEGHLVHASVSLFPRVLPLPGRKPDA